MSKGNPDNNSLVFTRQFHDPYKFAEAIKTLKIKRGAQLSPGSFLGTLNFTDFGDLKLKPLVRNLMIISAFRWHFNPN
ncbi:MAG: hypothetical protein ACK5GT_17865 [Aphanizomenon sp.]|jgi:hypothetical protein